MDLARQRARFDWVAELTGAGALGLAAGFAAFKAAPSLGFGPVPAMLAGAAGSFALALLAMRTAPSDPRVHPLPAFALEPIAAPGPLDMPQVADEPLLLDTPFLEPCDDIALLLEDVLPEAHPDSRVVRLFAAQPMPTPGQLGERIDRHLATGTMHVVREFDGPASDASDALFAALSELKRSLR